MRIRPRISALAVAVLFSDSGITYLLRDLFNNAQSLPAAGNTFAPDHVGLWEVEQVNSGVAAIASSELRLKGTAGAGAGDQGDAIFGTDAAGNPFTHEAGLVLGVRWLIKTDLGLLDFAHLAFDASNAAVSASFDYQWFITGGSEINIRLSNDTIGTGITAVNDGTITYECWIALSDDGLVLLYADLEGDGYASLWWVAEQQALSTVYAWLWGRQVDLYAKAAAVGKLAATTFNPHQTVSGAVAESTSGTAPDGDSIFVFEITTLPSAGSVKLRVRKQDDSNYWEIEYDSAGDFNLNEIVAGSPTTRISGVAVLSGGEVGQLRLSGNEAKLFYNQTALTPYASASNFATETAWEMDSLGTSGVLSDLRTYRTHLNGQPLNTQLAEVLQE